MATIEEVAALAGVSIATVSRVMNNSYIVSQEKREKVLTAAASLHYQTNRSPARQSESRIIMVAGSALIYSIFAGIQDKAREFGCDVVFCYSNSITNGLKTMSVINRDLIDGIILLNYLAGEHELDEFITRYPLVECGGTQKIRNSITVSVNNERAAADVVNHLAGLGRRRIGLVMPELGLFTPQYLLEREKGYRLALLELGLPFDPELVFCCDLSPESVEEVVQRMLTLGNKPDALFCVTDRVAAGLLIALRDKGVRIPVDIAVAGFDNDDISELLKPALTTVNQPYYEIGCECVRLLMAQVKDDNIIGRQVLLSHNLIVRGSTVGEN